MYYPLNECAERCGFEKAEEVEVDGGKRVEDPDSEVPASEIGGEEEDRDDVGDPVGGGGRLEEGADQECESEHPK